MKMKNKPKKHTYSCIECGALQILYGLRPFPELNLPCPVCQENQEFVLDE